MIERAGVSSESGIFLKKGQGLIFFDRLNYIVCDGLGKPDTFFIGDIVVKNDRANLAHFSQRKSRLHFAFLKGFDCQADLKLQNKCFLLGSAASVLPDVSDSLILFNFQHEDLVDAILQYGPMSLKYLASRDTSFKFVDLELKFLSQLSVFEEGIKNADLIKRVIKVSSKGFSVIKRKRALIFDLGFISETLLFNLSKIYDIYIFNINMNINVVGELDLDLILISDGFCDCEIAYFQFINKLELLISYKIPIAGVGLGMYILARRIGASLTKSIFTERELFSRFTGRVVPHINLINIYPLPLLSDLIESTKQEAFESFFESLDSKFLYGFKIKGSSQSFYCFYNEWLFSNFLISSRIS